MAGHRQMRLIGANSGGGKATNVQALGRRSACCGAGVVVLLAAWVHVQAGVATFVYTGPSVTIPEQNWVSVPLEVSGQGLIGFNSITNLSISLTITGGRNNDTIVRLRAPNDGPYIYLINRPSVGYTRKEAGGNYNDDHGFVVTISDSGIGDIHLYRLYNAQFDSQNRLLGTWQPDGRDVPPGSRGDDYKTATRYSLAEVFNGVNPVGTWHLELADWGRDSLPPAVLEGWALEITAVPEPAHTALVVWILMIGAASGAKLLLRELGWLTPCGRAAEPDAGQ